MISLNKVSRRSQLALRSEEDGVEGKPKAKAKGRPKAKAKNGGGKGRGTTEKTDSADEEKDPKTKPEKKKKTEIPRSDFAKMAEEAEEAQEEEEMFPKTDDEEEEEKKKKGKGKGKQKDGLESAASQPAETERPGRKRRIKKTEPEVVEEEGQEQKKDEETEEQKSEEKKKKTDKNLANIAELGKERPPKRSKTGEAATFARRAEPSSEYGKMKWGALREAFNQAIKPHLSTYSAAEDLCCGITPPWPVCSIYIWLYVVLILCLGNPTGYMLSNLVDMQVRDHTNQLLYWYLDKPNWCSDSVYIKDFAVSFLTVLDLNNASTQVNILS